MAELPRPLNAFVCSKCGRAIHPNDKRVSDWLIGRRVDDPAKLVVRCPQHITERTLRMAGRRRTKRMYQWAVKVKAKDRPEQPPLVLPLDESTIKKARQRG